MLPFREKFISLAKYTRSPIIYIKVYTQVFSTVENTLLLSLFLIRFSRKLALLKYIVLRVYVCVS